MAQVQLDNIEKSYGAVTAVETVDLDVADGEFVVLLGPSGCGKSTTLRMVAGLETVSSGMIRIGGRDVTRVDPKDRGVAMVFQNYALYPHKTVAENMGMALKMRGDSRAEIDRRVGDVAEMLGLGALLHRRPAALSGGQRQRVAIGRAIVRTPEVFLFDEPLSNLDAKLRVRTRGELQRLHERLGITSLYVTHDQIEAMTLADRIVIMNEGRIAQIGTPSEVYARPENLFVADFIGSPAMNLIEIAPNAGPEPFDLPAVGLARAPVVIGVRPERLHLAAPGQAAGAEAWSLPGRITLVELLGAEGLVTVEIGRRGEEPVELIVRMPAEALPDDGHETLVWAALDDLHFFDPTTGLRKA
jgi:sn-glycerol 3-phosphate transport system ATP-binding protein/multiple sugar transport system ATP-binding protein